MFPSTLVGISDTDDSLTKLSLVLRATSPGITSSPCLNAYLPKLSI